MDYTIRQATSIDHDWIFNLLCESIRSYVEPIWGWDEAYQQKDFDESFNVSQFWVVEVEGRFAGFVQTYAHEGMLELCEIHLLPEYRGKGIGSTIIKKLLLEFNSSDRLL